jgi:ATP/maltotriose-dependent transcriptional regulator MalT
MPILKTKLHRPRVPADYVARPRLLKLLDRRHAVERAYALRLLPDG